MFTFVPVRRYNLLFARVHVDYAQRCFCTCSSFTAHSRLTRMCLSGSLAALVYQHSITPLALPCKLLLPEPSSLTHGADVTDGSHVETTSGHSPASNSQLLAHGAGTSACRNVCVRTLYKYTWCTSTCICTVVRA